MYIFVATGAVQILPTIDRGRLRLEFSRLLVAIGARHRNVSPGENKASLFVVSQSEGRRLVSLQIVATIAGIEVRRADELACVLIGMTIRAFVELDFEQSVLPFRDVTLVACDARVAPLQRISTGGVLLHAERRRLPTLNGVAGETLAASVTLGKLAIMRIGLMAIRALAEHQRLFEVAVGMALRAIDGRVLAF